MEKVVASVCKLSHKQFRSILKKFRRKRIRQKLAKERKNLELLEQQKKENSPSYKEIQEEIRRNSELYEQFEERERIRQHKLWLIREEQAQAEFRRKQQQLELEKIKREEERKRILEEFERQEYVEKQAKEVVEKVKSQKEEALQEALSNLSEADGPWHNPIAPENYNIGQEREQCMFFSKTGCCRFGDRCSRGHTRPATSTTILIRGMYSHFSIDQTGRDDYDTDIALEYEDKECYQDFKNFYNDVLPEFKRFGKVLQFKVCNNFEPHLRGNVYVQYSREEEAIEAYKNFNGRYYAGKQITCDFTHVIRWRSAICGLHGRNLCPKGINCNFLHVFKNPHDEFWEADRDLPSRDNRQNSNSSRKRNDRSSHHTSERRHRSSAYESKSDRHGSRNDRYESRNGRYESRSDRHESRSERYESRSDRHESRSDRHDSRSDRYESRNDSHYDKSESKSDKYDVKNNADSSENGSDYSEENSHSKNSVIMKDQDGHKSKKRHRDPSSSSNSNSPEESSQKRRSHKKKKHRKKKSKKHKMRDYNGDSTE